MVDDGVYYNHPLLGGGFGTGFKVIGGHDFNPGHEEDEDPTADPTMTTGHGTHVAGIIAGKSEFFSGVAPDANILAYKIFGFTGEVRFFPANPTNLGSW